MVSDAAADVLRSVVQESMSYHLYDNAVWFAERLFAQRPCLETLHLVADARFRSGDWGHTARMLRAHWPFQESVPRAPGESAEDADQHVLQLQYLFGVSLMKSHRYQEAESVLSLLRTTLGHICPAPMQSAVSYWLGVAAQRQSRSNISFNLEQSIDRWHFNWSALELLNERGSAASAIKCEDIISGRAPGHSAMDMDEQRTLPSTTPGLWKGPQGGLLAQPRPGPGVSPIAQSLMGPGYPPPPGGLFGLQPGPFATPPAAPQLAQQRQQGGSGQGAPQQPAVGPVSPLSTASVLTAASTAPGSRTGRRAAAAHSRRGAAEHSPEGTQEAAQLVASCAACLRCSVSYRQQELLHSLQQLPEQQRNSAYFVAMVARGFYDQAEYAPAREEFRRLRQQERWRVDPAYAQYSSCLWQMRLNQELATLSQELIELDRNSATTQVVLGNTHSIVGEHEFALKFLRRAVQVDKEHHYAITLCGMEHVLLDEADEAMQCFRNALRNNNRDYAAWHGMGSVYMKQEDFQLARHHMEKAKSINPNPPICIALSRVYELDTPPNLAGARQAVEAVLRVQPKNLIARLRRAQLLVKERSYRDALPILEELQHDAPREVEVLALLGKVYAREGNRNKALHYYNAALGLSMRDNVTIRTAIEKLAEQVAEEDAGTPPPRGRLV
eukprot:TRINITY_DN23773_c0_g1_i1.p1 TRINITY_DN23773_c0_g1~~TRINITY_DN23773_c0_g1_i1.p1  ORF type:complete len:670 (+),score=220.14 TRINITY_DN23773_c0_g1_i1:115-2124(+)